MASHGREHLARVPLAKALRALLSWHERRRLEGTRAVAFDRADGIADFASIYLEEGGPSVAVRLQEVFWPHTNAAKSLGALCE